MKFIVQYASIIEFKGGTKEKFLNKYTNKIEEHQVMNINTLDELMEFKKKYGQDYDTVKNGILIEDTYGIDIPTITIVDDYITS